MSNTDIKSYLEGIVKDSDNKLYKEVSEIALNHIEDYTNYMDYFKEVLNYGSQTGIITELIYHKDTEDFFNKFTDEIFEIYNDLKEKYGNVGIPLSKDSLTYLAFDVVTMRIGWLLEE